MVIKWNVTIPKLSGEKPRRAYICLPESYEENKDKFVSGLTFNARQSGEALSRHVYVRRPQRFL